MPISDNFIAKIRSSQKWPVFVVLLVFLSNLFFSTKDIEKFAAVDEPLWLFGRVESYWNGIKSYDLAKTLVSDKPGITVSLISGIGLLWEKPAEFDAIAWEGRLYRQRGDIEALYLALRLPIAIFSSLSLFLFYFLLQKLSGKTAAVFAIILLGTSPILIGMSRIINPDSLLWIFSSLSILAHLVYLKTGRKKYLFSAGFSLGLALLTKYVANILLIYFLAVIFLEYVFMREKFSGISPKRYLKNSFLDYLLLTLSAFGTFFALCPAAWINPLILLDATLLSQAFESTWIFFVLFLGTMILDTFLLKSFVFSHISRFLQDRRKIIAWIILLLFLLPILFSLINVWAGMKMIDFAEIISSPKSSHKLGLGSFVTYLSNFYPLVFGISPAALIILVFSLAFLALKNRLAEDPSRNLIYLIFFILLYYAGSAATNVASMTRYQIAVYPIALIAAGLALGAVRKNFFPEKRLLLGTTIALLLIATVIPLYHIRPFYSSYNSILLPEKYFIDLKDMGTGSYEAAQYLNSLPDPENIVIWTDKTGMCYVFKGLCFSGFNRKKLEDKEISYVVVSSGRESRTGKMAGGSKNSPLYFPKYYSQEENVEFWLKLDGRPNQFVKIIKINGR